MIGLSAFIAGSGTTAEQIESTQESALRVFLDMSSYQDYVKEHIPLVNYVRDREQADLHILVTSQGTGGRGTEYAVMFTGLRAFAGVNDTLTCVVKDEDTEEYTRSEIVRLIKLGLIRYVSRTPQAHDVSITYRQRAAPAEVKDNWDYWVFGIAVNTSLSGEKSRKQTNYSGGVTADRVTLAWKISLGAATEYGEDRYDTGQEIVTSISQVSAVRGLVVKSLDNHWSVGANAEVSESQYFNLDLSAELAPAIEFDIFPYSESTRRDLRVMYTFGCQLNKYKEETIYFVSEEYLLRHELSIELDVKENWGTLRGRLVGSNYLRDFDLNRLTFTTQVYFRVSEGISLSIAGNYSAIHDQIELPRRGATIDDILLRRRQLATQYQYGMSVGLTYRFGSKYANIVNPRF